MIHSYGSFPPFPSLLSTSKKNGRHGHCGHLVSCGWICKKFKVGGSSEWLMIGKLVRRLTMRFTWIYGEYIYGSRGPLKQVEDRRLRLLKPELNE